MSLPTSNPGTLSVDVIPRERILEELTDMIGGDVVAIYTTGTIDNVYYADDELYPELSQKSLWASQPNLMETLHDILRRDLDSGATVHFVFNVNFMDQIIRNIGGQYIIASFLHERFPQ